jgi:hypothetical protein
MLAWEPLKHDILPTTNQDAGPVSNSMTVDPMVVHRWIRFSVFFLLNRRKHINKLK